ncbi:hypothetical protein [Streptomyces sp. NPDC096033]|uniref:ATP-dependent DNA ligase n=1 Tax=Streptomyces sp. NPDC096033 TaxID=3366071 RepID=UPI00382224EA
MQDRWPDLGAAAEAQLPHGLVLDGELLVWDAGEGRLSFEALQRRAAARGRSAPALAAKWPAYFAAFDVLQQSGQGDGLTGTAGLNWRSCSPTAP